MRTLGIVTNAVAAFLMVAEPAVAAGPSKAPPTKTSTSEALFTKAVTSDVKGKIHTVDPVNHSVSLADGQHFIFPPEVKVDGFKEGDEVSINSDDRTSGARNAKTITKEVQ